jgi:hypothetical protein
MSRYRGGVPFGSGVSRIRKEVVSAVWRASTGAGGTEDPREAACATCPDGALTSTGMQVSATDLGPQPIATSDVSRGRQQDSLVRGRRFDSPDHGFGKPSQLLGSLCIDEREAWQCNGRATESSSGASTGFCTGDYAGPMESRRARASRVGGLLLEVIRILVVEPARLRPSGP